MGFIEVVKILFVPGLIAAVLYGLISFVILPLIRNHRERYSQYLPLNRISQHTDGIRDRLANFITRLVVPRRRDVVDAESGSGSRRGSRSESGEDFTLEDGERMVGFNVDGASGRRGEAR